LSWQPGGKAETKVKILSRKKMILGSWWWVERLVGPVILGEAEGR
jgi:hypothetical protein